MRRGILLGFLALLTLDTAAQVSMKLAADKAGGVTGLDAWLWRIASEPLVYFIVGLYVVSFLTYVTLLKHAPVGPAYAAAHGHIVTVSAVSVLFLGERLNGIQFLGAAAIVAGIVILAVTETPETHDLVVEEEEKGQPARTSAAAP
ncbi:MAG: EamA family transporter [Hyphomicrobiaceae bacterium]|nr:EamA family transporter [Hyphomicrobiaceae bacterium]